MKKSILMLVCITTISVSMFSACRSKPKESNIEQPQVETPVTEQPQPVPTPTQPETPAPEPAKVYTTLEVQNISMPVEIYESDSIIELPADSLLALVGIFVTQGEGVRSISYDSTKIPQDMDIHYNKTKGKCSITQFGKTKEYTCNKVSVENGTIMIDNKPIVPEKALTTLRIGVPKGNPAVLTGNNCSYKATASLGSVTINIKGNSTVSLGSVEKLTDISVFGGSTVDVKYVTYADKISIKDSANITLQKCDSIYTASVINKGVLYIPNNTSITKESTKQDGDIVKR